jgi:signal recognition particle receptor subunit beta
MVSLLQPSANELKILFTGTVGAGKTTAINAISEKVTLSTDVPMSEGATDSKSHTTVGFDYGECALADGCSLHLYGTPGQERFRFMWDILARGAFGLIVLADHSRPDPIGDVLAYLQAFAGHFPPRRIVVGVGRLQAGSPVGIEQYVERLVQAGFDVPVLEADVRKADDVRLLLSILVSMAEAEIE